MGCVGKAKQDIATSKGAAVNQPSRVQAADVTPPTLAVDQALTDQRAPPCAHKLDVRAQAGNGEIKESWHTLPTWQEAVTAALESGKGEGFRF